jgi:hypothetical protein
VPSSGIPLILKHAKKNNVSKNDMPEYLLILSDMQFNMCDRNWKSTAYKMIKQQYEDAGYEMPKIVFWNLADRGSNIPVSFNKDGVGLVSGFSPSIMKTILSGGDMNPYQLKLDTIDNPRYQLRIL